MAEHGKRYRADIEKFDREKIYPLEQAVDFVKSFADRKFDQSIELCLHLGIDPKQADQLVRGAVSLPHGIGATKRVIAFCAEDKVPIAKGAGAMEAGGEELVKRIEGGWMDFDVAVATPDMMRIVSKLGRVLGPRGLMPSPKAGTVSPDVAQAVKEYAAGKAEFRNDAGGNVQVIVGRKSFDKQKLLDNTSHFIEMIKRLKPASSKGTYIKKASLSATMSPGVLIEV